MGFYSISNEDYHQVYVTYIRKKNCMELVSNFGAEKYFAQYLLLGANAFFQTHQDYLNHSRRAT